jgi:hypothetical protein
MQINIVLRTGWEVQSGGKKQDPYKEKDDDFIGKNRTIPF